MLRPRLMLVYGCLNKQSSLCVAFAIKYSCVGYFTIFRVAALSMYTRRCFNAIWWSLSSDCSRRQIRESLF